MFLKRCRVVLAGANLYCRVNCLLIGCQLESVRLWNEPVQDTNSALTLFIFMVLNFNHILVSTRSWVFVEIFLKLNFGIEPSLFISELMLSLNFHACVREWRKRRIGGKRWDTPYRSLCPSFILRSTSLKASSGSWARGEGLLFVYENSLRLTRNRGWHCGAAAHLRKLIFVSLVQTRPLSRLRRSMTCRRP